MSEDPIKWGDIPTKKKKGEKGETEKSAPSRARKHFIPDNTGRTKVDPKKAAEAIYQHRGLLSPAARQLGIARRTLARYCDRFPVCAEARDSARAGFVDKCENVLEALVEAGDVKAVIFALKTLGKDRGYVERSEITGADGQPLAPSWFVEIENEEGDVERLDALPVDEAN